MTGANERERLMGTTSPTTVTVQSFQIDIDVLKNQEIKRNGQLDIKGNCVNCDASE